MTEAPNAAVFNPENPLVPHNTEPSQRQYSPAKAVWMPAVAALLALTAACVEEDAAGETIFTPEVIGTAALPLSESENVALLADERTACVVDSYEIQVRCVDGEGAVVGVFGREGEGPGEFGSPSYLARGVDGTVGVHDGDLGRFTVFEPSGARLSEVVVAADYYVPFRSFDDVLSGVSLDIFAMLGGGNSGPLMTRFDVNITTGEVLREAASPSGPWDVACGEVVYGIPDRGEGWVFMACEGHLIFVGDTGDATVLRAPTYLAELPDDRDVARREEIILSVSRMIDQPAPAGLEGMLEEYRATPKEYRLGTQHQLVDAANRYWIATLRDTHDWSYLDVYENAGYVGSVRVRDRLRGFDLLGSTLVALVERQVGADDADGIPDRALDWYDIGDFGLRR